MKLLRVFALLALVLALQVMLGRIMPQSQRYVDWMLVPVVWYGLAGSQRSGMLVGCLSGLVQDAWFELDLLGLNGFKRTLLGYVLGTLGTRIDLNHPLGRLASGTLASVADSLLDIGLRRLLDQKEAAAGVGEILSRGLVTGVLVVVFFALLARLGGGPQHRAGLGRAKGR